MRTRISGTKRLSTLTALFLISILILTSCSSPTPTAPPPAAGQAEHSTDIYEGLNLVVPNRYDPPIEMSSVTSVDATVKFLEGDDIHNNIWTRTYASLLGINLRYDWVVDASMYDQKLGLSVNSGDIPDMFVVDSAQFLTYYEAGLLADLTDAYEAEASDATRDILSQDPIAMKVATIDGKLLGIPLTDASVTSASVLWIRQDWLDRLGIPAPTSMADVLEISRRFTEEDPDGDGVDDTIGLAVTKDLFGAIASLQGFFNGYHAYPGIWFERDGSIVYGSVQPEMRDALLALQKMYADGQIDREFGVKDINQVTETISQGKCGMEFGVWWNPYHPLNLSQANDPDAYWQAYAIPSIDETPAKSQYTSAIASFLVVREGYEHPEALIRMVNFWTDNIVRSQDDNVRNLFLGNLDNPDVVLYKYTPVVLWEPTAGIKTGRQLREALAKRDPTGLNREALWRYRIMQAYFEQGTKEAWVEVATNGPNGSVVILEDVLGDRGLMNRFYGMPTPAMAEKMPTLSTMESEMITKIIMGEPIDQFDRFVETWHQMGGAEITEEVNQWAASNP